jgi:hypothetical protein
MPSLRRRLYILPSVSSIGALMARWRSPSTSCPSCRSSGGGSTVTRFGNRRGRVHAISPFLRGADFSHAPPYREGDFFQKKNAPPMQQMVILNYILRKSVGRLVGVAWALRRAQRRAKRAANCRRKNFYSPAQFDLHPHNSSYTPAQKMQATRTERRPKKRQSPPEFAPAQFLFLTRTL